MNKAKFLKICCPRCKECKIVYGKASIKIKCDSCGYLLVKTGGGKARVRAPIKQVL